MSDDLRSDEGAVAQNDAKGVARGELSLRSLEAEELLEAALLLRRGAELVRAQGEEPGRVRPPSAIDLSLASLLLRVAESSAVFAPRELLGSAFGYRNPGVALGELAREAPFLGDPRARGMFTGGPNGAFLAHAAGAGWAFRLKEEASIAVAAFDAAIVESGEFHTGVNFAAVNRARVVYFSIEPEAGALANTDLAYGIESETIVVASVADLLRKISSLAPAFVHYDVSAIAKTSLADLVRELTKIAGISGARLQALETQVADSVETPLALQPDA